MHRLVLGLAAALALTAGAALGQSALDQQIKELQAAEAEATVHGNLAGLDKLWAPNLTVNFPGERALSREELEQAISSGRLKYLALVRRPEHIADYGEVIVVMGRETATPARGGAAGEPLSARYTDVWQKTPLDGRWRLIARHTGLPFPG